MIDKIHVHREDVAVIFRVVDKINELVDAINELKAKAKELEKALLELNKALQNADDLDTELALKSQIRTIRIAIEVNDKALEAMNKTLSFLNVKVQL